MNDLLKEWQDRFRILGRDAAIHPYVLRRVMAALDKAGPSEAGDCIQSLVFEAGLLRERAHALHLEMERK